jgi:hypothetical protein
VLTAAVVLARAIGRRRVHLLDLAGLGYFLALGAVLVESHAGHLDFWARYAQAGSHIALTTIVFGSILIGRPFTESYARQTTTPAAWDTPGFHDINRRISAVWGLAFLVGTVSLLMAGSVDYHQVLLRVVIPFGALVWAYKYTQGHTSAAQTSQRSASLRGELMSAGLPLDAPPGRSEGSPGAPERPSTLSSNGPLGTGSSSPGPCPPKARISIIGTEFPASTTG